MDATDTDGSSGVGMRSAVVEATVATDILAPGYADAIQHENGTVEYQALPSLQRRFVAQREKESERAREREREREREERERKM